MPRTSLLTPGRLAVRLFAAVACVLIAGCGGAKRPTTVPVGGQVLVNGTPYPGVQVTFVPLSGAAAETLRPSAFTDGEGKFRLSSYSSGDGAPEGEYAVLVAYRPLVGRGDEAQPGPNVLPARYAD